MTFNRSFSLLILFVAAGATDLHPDRIEHFPGYPYELPSAWYSGYLEYELDETPIHTHYIYVEAETSEEPSNLPVIYWSNGGPGASSLFGLFTELGPLMFSDLSVQTKSYKETGIPTPLYNPDSWTKLGSVLVFDAPAPVGFSFCNNDTAGEGYSCLSWTDELASLNTYTALQTFFTDKFPELQSRPLYLTGESYAGIYIPTLARRVLQGNFEFNLKGFAVGDGCLGTDTPLCGGEGLGKDSWTGKFFHLLFMAGHGQIPYSTYLQALQKCGGDPTVPGAEDREVAPECQKMLDSIKDELGGFFDYSLYDDCAYSNGLLLRNNLHEFQHFAEGGLTDFPCGGGPVMDHYLTFTAVKEAFHIPASASFFNVDNAMQFDYTPTEPDLRDFYMDVANGVYGADIRVLVYNGDTDPAITSFAAQYWTSNLGFNESQSWRAWTIDGCRRMGGYVTRYDGNFDFLTIRGAGHMVPTYKPDATLAFLKAWVSGEDYPEYDAGCKSPPGSNSVEDLMSIQKE